MINAVMIALQAWGERSVAGTQHNPIILWFFKLAGNAWVKDDETAWCAAFVGWVLAQAGYKNTGSLSARSYLTYGKEVKKPMFGCVVVLWREKIDSVYGHVGFFIRETTDSVYLLGGNQSNEVNITKFPKSRVLGYRAY